MKPYVREYPNTWWLSRRPYFLFMVREFTAVFVAAYCVFLIYFVYKLSQGPDAYYGVIELLRSPLSIILHIIAFIFAIYHSITWFNLTPKIFILRFGEEQVPPFLISGANFIAWVVVSAIVAWIILVV
ncbi:fumarate reductase subunit C [Desulfobacterota bacterium AH_259_B03_O07]|nr:fumarate reductase subunit C [Desulfobacterota bacterium AH_259_B03_O07]